MKNQYTVRGWDSQFENSQSRKCRNAAWVPIPNKHDGKSYRRLIAMPNGPAIYSAWMLILQVASKCPKRGVLLDDDGPLDADDLSAKTGCPSELFSAAFEVLTGPRIGWLEAKTVDPTGSTVGACSHSTPSTLSHHPAVSSLNRTEGKGTEEKKGSASADPGSSDLDEFVKAWNESGLTMCRKLTDKRRKTLRTRLADSDWNANWRKALQRAAQSPFCRGQNDRGWKADVDWFISPDALTRIMEGKYDDAKSRSNQPSADEANAIMTKHTQDVLERKLAEQEARQAAKNGGVA